jgi:hypothetical protein
MPGEYSNQLQLMQLVDKFYEKDISEIDEGFKELTAFFEKVPASSVDLNATQQIGEDIGVPLLCMIVKAQHYSSPPPTLLKLILSKFDLTQINFNVKEKPGSETVFAMIATLAAFGYPELLKPIFAVIDPNAIDYNQADDNGRTPLWWLAKGVKNGSVTPFRTVLQHVSWENLDFGAISQGTIDPNTTVRDFLVNTVWASKVDLFISLQEAKKLYTQIIATDIPDFTSLERHLETTLALAETALKDGHTDAFFQVAQFFQSIDDMENYQKMLARIPRESECYSEAVFGVTHMCMDALDGKEEEDQENLLLQAFHHALTLNEEGQNLRTKIGVQYVNNLGASTAVFPSEMKHDPVLDVIGVNAKTATYALKLVKENDRLKKECQELQQRLTARTWRSNCRII